MVGHGHAAQYGGAVGGDVDVGEQRESVRVDRGLLSLRAEPEVQERIEYLADRCTAGLITSDEREEYEALIAAGELISILQAKANATLSGNTAA